MKTEILFVPSIEYDYRDYSGAIIHSKKYDLDVAYCIQEAIQAIQNREYDLVIFCSFN